MRGRSRHELIAAAHTTIVLAALFDALRETLGPIYESLELTDREELQLAAAPGEIVSQSGWIDQLAGTELPLPSAVVGFEENLTGFLAPRVADLADGALAFFEGLRAWNEPLEHIDILDCESEGELAGRPLCPLILRGGRRWTASRIGCPGKE